MVLVKIPVLAQFSARPELPAGSLWPASGSCDTVLLVGVFCWDRKFRPQRAELPLLRFPTYGSGTGRRFLLPILPQSVLFVNSFLRGAGDPRPDLPPPATSARSAPWIGIFSLSSTMAPPGGSKKRGKGHVEDEEEEEFELILPSKLTARQQAAQRNVKSPAVCGKKVHVSVKNMPYLEYKELRQGNPYLIPRNNRVGDKRFHNKSQEEIFYEIYVTFKKGIVTQHSIDTAKMAATRYFDEAYALCGEFGLYPIMELNKDYDVGLIQQFYATVHFEQDEARTFRWMTHETLLEANLASFGDALGYPRSPVVNANGWRSHDSSFAHTKEVLEPLYIKGWGVPGKSADFLPTWDIMLRVYRETIGPKGGNLDELHTYEVDLMANSHAKQGTGEKLDVMDYIYNEMWTCVMEKKLPLFAPFIMKLIEDTWMSTSVNHRQYQQHFEAKKSRARQKSIMRALNVEVSSPPGSEENITPEAEWVSEHGIPLLEDGLEIQSPPHTPPHPGAPSDLPPGWANADPWDA
ncbi:hypothetical protein QYE76_067320 [Lolium multiflorum]|uniref:Uncharacterized protein n=1 Tax=Lolium multiflorum TaxID=4521 RepID=A0AAD8SEL7_LOLMU|nr:hypothetical protein QYE76_067320 [Lolium multiflorum]